MTEVARARASAAGTDDADGLEERIERWLVNYIAEVLAVPPTNIDTAASFQKLGLDSSAAVGMTGDLNDWLGGDMDATAAYDYPTINSLAHAIATGVLK